MKGHSGAGFKPPAPDEMYRQIKNFFQDLPYRTDLNPIELAAWTHEEFVKIHPFAEMVAALEETRLDEYLAIGQEPDQVLDAPIQTI